MNDKHDDIASQTPIVVTRRPGDWRKIEVPFGALFDWRISDITGGVGRRTPRPAVMAYMSCDAIPEGADFGHSCRHGPHPHMIKVVVQKVDNPRTYARLRALAEGARA